ncbi:hypothetical protein [Microbacterium sp. gxy059]|uniref:hypothetical protein n=1 Tax=Microbacterium sp. gxy059 TaxID=2957199 RepID=UPI003D99CDC0
MTAWRDRHPSPVEDDEGSTLVLAIAYAALALAALFVCVCGASLHLAQRQLDAVADAAALAAADGFVLASGDGGVRTVVDETAAEGQARDIVDAARHDARLVSAEVRGGSSVRVTVAATWRPPLPAILVPSGMPLEATATSRSALAGGEE